MTAPAPLSGNTSIRLACATLALCATLAASHAHAEEPQAPQPFPDPQFPSLSQSATAMESVTMQLLTIDARSGAPEVWLDRGRQHGLEADQTFTVSIEGETAGVLTLNSVLSASAAGRFNAWNRQAADRVLQQGEPVTLIPRAAPAATFTCLAMPCGNTDPIAIPRTRSAPFASPWNSDYDTGLNEAFRAIADAGAPPAAELPPPPPTRSPAQVDATHLLAPYPEPDQAPEQFIIRPLDPDLAREIKSGYFIEPGDCLHIAPWPDHEQGHFTVIGREESLSVPGGYSYTTRGRTLTRLENELRTDPVLANEEQPVLVSPCTNTGGGS